MAKKESVNKKGKKSDCNCDNHCSNKDSKCGGVYFLGFIGSAVYYISTATSFWNGVLGLAKSLAWPAFLVFELLKLVGA